MREPIRFFIVWLKIVNGDIGIFVITLRQRITAMSTDFKIDVINIFSAVDQAGHKQKKINTAVFCRYPAIYFFIKVTDG